MKVISRYVSLISVTGLLAGGSLIAQTSGTTSGSSGSGSSSSTQPYNSTNSGGQRDNTGSSMSSGTDASGSGSSNYNAPGTSTRNSGTSAGATGSSSDLGTGSATGSTPGAVGATGSAFSGMTDPLASSIQSADFNTRNQLTTQIEQQLDSQQEALKSVKKGSKDLEGQARSDFKSAWSDVEDREKDLKRSLREARNASQQQWESIRSELSSKYQAYLSAVSRVQMQAGSALGTPSSSSGMNQSDTLRSGSGSSSSTGTSGTTGTSGSGTTGSSGSTGSTVPPTTTP